MRQYTRGLAEVGARVFAIGDTPKDGLTPDLKRHISAYLQVPRIMDEDDVIRRATDWLRGRELDRVVTNWEPLVHLAARMRDRWGVPGMSADVARGFRDKKLMKERVAAAGLRVPRSARASTVAEVRSAAEQLGFPLIIKPIAGAGSANTYRVDDAGQLEKVIKAVARVPEVSVEEYVDGEEFTYDTLCIDGKPVYENVAQYLPKPIIMRSVESNSPIIITVRDMKQEKIQPGIELGRKVLDALKMHDGFTHMEWFLTPQGEAVMGEIGARPGGAMLVDQMNYTGDIDLFREWARVVCWKSFGASTERKYNAGIIFKRAKGQGCITAIHGLDEFMRKYGKHVVEQRLLPIGAPRRDWTQTLVSDGHLMVRHPDWDMAKKICFAAADEIQMYAG